MESVLGDLDLKINQGLRCTQLLNEIMNIIKHARFINESVAFRLAILTEMFFSRDTSQISIERTICNLKLLI